MSTSRLLWSSLTITAALALSACSPSQDANDTNADAQAAGTAGKTLRIATEGAYPPFNYTNADAV